MINRHTIPIRNAFTGLVPWVSESVDRVRFATVLLSRFQKVGFFAPFPYRLKRGIMQYAAERFGMRALVETGTYLGDTPWYFRKRMDVVHTIEVSPMLHECARKRFKRWPNVHAHLGDSGAVLPSIVPTLTLPTLFWLDGHYDKGITGKGELECPIYKELEAIFGLMRAPWLIMIDDARNFGKARDYPDLDTLRAFVAGKLPAFSMWAENDIIWLSPRAGLDSLACRGQGLRSVQP